MPTASDRDGRILHNEHTLAFSSTEISFFCIFLMPLSIEEK